jgi:tricorn protease
VGIESLPPLELEQYWKDAAAAAKKRKPLAAPGADSKPAKDKNDEKPDAEQDAKKDEAAKDEPARLDLDDAYKRLRRVTTLPGNETGLEITPAGDRLVFNGANGTDAGLHSVGWDGKDLKKLGATGAVQQVSLSGDVVVFVAGGRASTAHPTTGGAKVVAIADTLRVDLAAQAAQTFKEAARLVGEVFYHPTLKGLDWPALSERYFTLAARCRTGDEFNDVANRFLGELNASHLGIRAKGFDAPAKQPNGRLGIDAEPVEGGYRVTRVVPYGPGDKGDMRLVTGDVITEVELVAFATDDTLLSRLRGRAGDETLVTVLRGDASVSAPKTLRLLLTPVSDAADTNLRYDAWQAENARRVHTWSNGRIGYIHVRGMNEPSLEEYERDLFAAAEGRQGLLVDVRNNGGGYTADRLLASITVTPHAYTVPRGADPTVTDGYPRDRLFIQRYVMPMNMLCNEKSFSNAEIVSHAFKTLGRGSLVGQQTYGGVISTGGTQLVDGTFVRLPFRGWYLPDGTDMENHGAVPDVLVPQTPEAESEDRDDQLKAAVDDLLKRL